MIEYYLPPLPGAGVPLDLTFEQFAAINRAGRQLIGDAGLHRSSERKSAATHRRQVLAQAREDAALIVRRARLRDIYAQLLAERKVREPSARQQTIARARGVDDADSVQAARRICERRGWDWRAED